MDQKTKQQNMHFDMEENQVANQEVYGTLNMDTILEPKSLRIEK